MTFNRYFNQNPNSKENKIRDLFRQGKEASEIYRELMGTNLQTTLSFIKETILKIRRGEIV